MAGLWSLVACLAVLFARGQCRLLAQTTLGTVLGHTLTVYNGQNDVDVDVWMNIPFAKPPVGELRFASTVAPEPWLGVLVGDQLGSVCIQDPTDSIATTNPDFDNYSEDCLNLNVFAPSTRVSPLPVIMYIHGGSFQHGGAVQFPGHFLASYDVVVVVINYRLNNLGFAFSGDGVIPGNAGLWDQRMALKFVQENVAAFGGDPDKITVMGQSAGAVSTAMLVVSPQTKDMFQQAIIESGTESVYWGLNNPISYPANYTLIMAFDLGCPTADTQLMVDCLRLLNATTIREHKVKCKPGFLCLGMSPVVDGAGGFLPDWPRQLRYNGDIMNGPMLTGICRNDGAIATEEAVPNANNPDGFSRTEYLDAIAIVLSLISEGITSLPQYDELELAFQYNYAPWPYIENGILNRQGINDLVTDYAFGAPWDYMIKSQSFYAPSFGYVFDYRSVNYGSVFPEWMGVPHTGDIPYFWGIPFLPLNPDVAVDMGGLSVPVNWTDADRQFSIYMQTMVTNFVKHGDPTPGAQGVQNPFDSSFTKWKPFSWNNTNYLYADRQPFIGELYNQKNFAFVYDYYPELGGIFFDGRPVDGSMIPQLPASTGQHLAPDTLKRLQEKAQKYGEDKLWKMLDDFLSHQEDS